jgi:hypothetical protein
MKLKELEMIKDKNKKGPSTTPKNGPHPPSKNIQKSGSTLRVKGGNNPKKDPTANLFEDNIRKVKKEGA